MTVLQLKHRLGPGCEKESSRRSSWERWARYHGLSPKQKETGEKSPGFSLALPSCRPPECPLADLPGHQLVTRKFLKMRRGQRNSRAEGENKEQWPHTEPHLSLHLLICKGRNIDQCLLRRELGLESRGTGTWPWPGALVVPQSWLLQKKQKEVYKFSEIIVYKFFLSTS